MRRAAQDYLERHATGPLPTECVDLALEEMLLGGGRLKLRLLGGSVEEADG